jgi:hypothetical protein
MYVIPKINPKNRGPPLAAWMFSIFTVTIILPINMVSNANKLFK